jgi:putative PIN family toxin of toxin-antitoxin system
MRVVLDTNQHISALIRPDGIPSKIVQLWRANVIELAVSLPLLEEIEDVAHRQRIQQKHGLSNADISEYLVLLREVAVVVPGAATVDVVKNDPDDNIVLSCALEAEADVIVSGDQHLLSLASYQGIPIVKAADFLRGCLPS